MALTKVRSGVRTLGTGEVATANMAVDPTNASNLSSGSVPLAQLGNAPATDLTTIEDDIALLGFKVASNGSFGKYNLVDQTEDAFIDATGVDASLSTNATRDASKYYSGNAPTAVTATGGTISTDGSYTIHTFTTASSPKTFTTDTAQSVDLLVVAGGAGGGGYCGGGGGAGGYISTIGHSVTATSYSITVGTGGAGATGGGSPPGGVGGNGGTSQFGSMTAAVGGGGGAGYLRSAAVGGSGGGSTSAVNVAGTAGQGYAGGKGTGASSQDGGGGGGASEVGEDGDPNGITPTNLAGDGGDGLSNSITGAAVFYAGGGGGGRGGAVISPLTGAGGNGGGGQGSSGASANAAIVGTANTGGGGGGGGYSPGGSQDHSAAGGSGIVILRRLTRLDNIGAMTLVSNSTTANDGAPTKGDIVMTYTNGAGTATLNTDLTAEFSANDGGAWTSMTLVAQGTTGSASPHFIVSAHNVTVGTSGTAMRYRIKTLNQSVAKETRIQAVSLGWS